MERTRLKPLLIRRTSVALGLLALLTAPSSTPGQTAPAPAVDTQARIQAAGRIRFGYRIDTKPFSYRDVSGGVAGYSVVLCERLAQQIKAVLGLRQLAIEWVPVSAADRFRAVREGTVDMVCAADTVTLGRRSEVAFSIPIFPGGIGVVLRADAPVRLRDVLSGREQTFHPTWRASASQVLQTRAFAVVTGTVADKWVAQRIDDLHLITKVTQVGSYEEGIQALLARRIDALFGERAILLDAARQHAEARQLEVLNRLFSYGPVALTLPPNDERFRLLVDRTLTGYYESGGLAQLYATWFGEPDAAALAFFKWSTVPD